MKLFEKILVPTDFSANAEHALRYAAELARAFDTPLSILHVYDVTPYVIPVGVAASSVLLDVGRLRAEFQKGVDAAKLLAQQAGATQVDTLLAEGTPYVEIARVAEERRFGLIVMGTHGRTGFAHFLLGSVAEKVVRKAPCPVITVPLRETPPKQS